MTAKRFTRIICSNDEYTGSLYCNDEPLKIEEVCTLLNELHEENQERKRAMRIAEQYNEQLLNENKKLKKYIDSISKGGLE